MDGRLAWSSRVAGPPSDAVRRLSLSRAQVVPDAAVLAAAVARGERPAVPPPRQPRRGCRSAPRASHPSAFCQLRGPGAPSPSLVPRESDGVVYQRRNAAGGGTVRGALAAARRLRGTCVGWRGRPAHSDGGARGARDHRAHASHSPTSDGTPARASTSVTRLTARCCATRMPPHSPQRRRRPGRCSPGTAHRHRSSTPPGAEGERERPSAVWRGAVDPPYLPSRRDRGCGGDPKWVSEIPQRDLQRALAAPAIAARCAS